MRASQDSYCAPALTVGRVAALMLAWLAIWLAAHPYQGIVGDGQLYVLQTLATMDPYPLGGDLFLRYGSQNNFTLFPRLAAPLVHFFGLEAAAATFTLVSSLLVLIGGWWLARTLSTSRMAWLAVGLLLAVQGWYGSGYVFRIDEMYVNARTPAEALSVFSIVLAIRERWTWSIPCAALAAMIHPVMAVPACALLCLLALDKLKPERFGYDLTSLTAITGACVVAVVALALPASASTDHSLWIDMLRSRTPFLFVQEWQLQDWLRAALTLSSLFVAASSLRRTPAGRIGYLVGLIGVLGISLAAVASVGQRFDYLLLAQPWRWMWLSLFVALALLPATLASLWKCGAPGRASALLLASGWALFNYSGGAMAIGAAALWFTRERIGNRSERVQVIAAGAAAVSAFIVLAALGAQALPLPLDDNSAPRWVQRMLNVAGLTGPIVLVAGGAWSAVVLTRPKWIAASIGILAAATIVGLMPYNVGRMTGQAYSENQHALFQSWRDVIPQDAEVLWNDPVAVWVLLERRSYLSGSQSAGLLYSIDATHEFQRRSQSLSALANPGWWTLAAIKSEDAPKTLTLHILDRICQDGELDFVVDNQGLGGQVLRAEWPGPGHYTYLYDCKPFRSGDH